MDKSTYTRLGLNVYQGTTSYGLKYVLSPIKDAKDVTIGIASRKGGSDDIESIGGTKIPLGTAHYLEHRMFQTKEGDADQIFSSFNCYSNAFTSRSTTFYYFTTNNDTVDYKKPLEFLMNMVTNFYMGEDDVENERQIIIGEIETNIDSAAYKFENTVLKASYFDSPFTNPDYIGSVESLKQVHLATLRKFFKAYYGLENLILFASGKFEPKEMAEFLETLKVNNAKSSENVIKRKYEKENYNKVKQSYTVIDSPDGQTYLGVGIKLPKREELVEKYGDLVFAFYEILPELVFSKVLKPIDKLYNDGIILYTSSLDVIQDGEDAMLTALFETNSPEKLKERLDIHLSSLTECYNPFSVDYKAIKNAYLASAIATINDTIFFTENMIDGFENHLSWPGIATRVLSLSQGDMTRFLRTVSSSPRAYVKLTPKDDTNKGKG